MISNNSMAGVYTDFQGLMQLKAEAGKQTPEAAEETARQFEAIFVQTMLKAMRDASSGEGMFESDQTKFYRDMYDQQLALHMVKGRGLGISKMLLSRIGTEQQPAAADSGTSQDLAAQLQMSRTGMVAGASQPLIAQAPGTPVIELNSTHPVQPLIMMTAATKPESPGSSSGTKDWRPQSPEEFIRDLLPHVRKGAAELGVDPAVLIAQSALETGWGQKVIRHAGGRSSFNLFGIKADSRWDGDKVRVETLEFADGVAQKQRASFRSYDSISGAVSGYVDFLGSNPRYQQALEQAGDADAFLHGLKDAGYATDPDYVAKIKAIMQRDSLEQTAAGLMTSSESAEVAGPG